MRCALNGLETDFAEAEILVLAEAKEVDVAVDYHYSLGARQFLQMAKGLRTASADFEALVLVRATGAEQVDTDYWLPAD